MYITQKRLFKWALWCNAIYVLLFFLVRAQGINFLKISITLLLLISVIIILFLATKNRKQLNQIPKFSRWLFYIIIIWGIITISRGLSFSLQDAVTNFGNVYMGLAWLTPVALIIGLNINNWTVVFRIINFIFNVMILVFLISLGFNNSYLQWAWLLRPVNFLLLMGLYRYTLLNKIKIYIIIGIYIWIANEVAQRMDLLFLFLTFSLLLLDSLFPFKLRRVFLKYIITAFLLVIILVFTVGYEYVSNAVATIIEFQDSRTFLFNELFTELNKTHDFWVGRGSLGTYYSQFFEGTRRYWELRGRIGWAGDVPERITIEVGYLQMILKGGILLLVLNITIFIYATYLAIFKSNNKFIKRLGYYTLIITTLSIISLRPAFTPTFLIFWMAIGTVLSKKFRNMSDEEINKLIKF